MQNQIKRPLIGVANIIIKENRVLMWKRKNAHWNGTWAFPWWHLEFWESWENCALREAKEEANIFIKNIRFCTITNDIFENEKKHYVTIYMLSDYDSWALSVLEPNKCEKWEWFEWSKLPSPLFLPIINLLKANFNPLKYE